jgi:hypothetical protein
MTVGPLPPTAPIAVALVHPMQSDWTLAAPPAPLVINQV